MTSTSYLLKTADLELNTNSHQVYKNKQLIKLSDLSFKTLMSLIKAHPNHVTIDGLIDDVWQSTAVSQETVTQRIAMIRKALAGPDDSNDKYIISIRSKGYRWVPVIEDANNNNSSLRYWKLMLLPVFLLVLFSAYYFKPHNKSDRSEGVESTLRVDDYAEQAWHYLDKHESKSNQLAIGLFRKSLEIDQNHLNALTGLSIALSHQVTKFNQSDALLVEAKQVAERAININPNHAQAWSALAFVSDAMGELNEAVSRYEKALKLNPDNTSTASSLSYLYGVQGRLVEAMQLNVAVLGSKQLYLNLQIADVLALLGFDALAEKWFEKADELSPDNVFVTHLRARFYLSRNQFKKADQVIDSAIDRGIERPELPLLKGIMKFIQGDHTLALSALEQAVAVDEADIESQVWLFILQNPNGVSGELKIQFIERWFSSPLSWPNAWVNQALFYAHFSDTHLAFDCLEQAFLSGYRNHRWLNQIPAFESLKADARWLNLIESIQNDVSKQRQQLLSADWLPTSFLDPSK